MSKAIFGAVAFYALFVCYRDYSAVKKPAPPTDTTHKSSDQPLSEYTRTEFALSEESLQEDAREAVEFDEFADEFSDEFSDGVPPSVQKQSEPLAAPGLHTGPHDVLIRSTQTPSARG